MSEKENNDAVPMAELNEFILKIPAEYFFCETIVLPAKLAGEDEAGKKQAVILFIQSVLADTSFSPYPEEQLAWGYFGSQEDGKIIVFACPLVKLRQHGWQNLEIFRRVFPSFVSFFGKSFDEPSILFLQEGESLSIASFDSGSKVPDHIFSLPVDLEDREALEIARGKLLSLVDSTKYQLIPDILIAGEVERLRDGNYQFEHEWKEEVTQN